MRGLRGSSKNMRFAQQAGRPLSGLYILATHLASPKTFDAERECRAAAKVAGLHLLGHAL